MLHRQQVTGRYITLGVGKREDRKGVMILAGGDSKRLGQPKALLDFNGESLIELMVKKLGGYFDDVLLVTDRRELYQNLSVQITGDMFLHQVKSPLRGIHAGLKFSALPYQFVIACDMPFINMGLVNYMAQFINDYEAVIPFIGGHFQPLHSFYHRSIIGVIEKQLQAGNYKITDFYQMIKHRKIYEDEVNHFDPDHSTFININTAEDYRAASKLIAEKNNTFNRGEESG